MPRKLYKKGFELQTLWILVELVVAAAFVVFLIWLGAGIYNALTAKPNEDKATMQNFETLAAEIKELIQNTDDFASKKTLYYISTDYVLVGFDTDWNELGESPDRDFQVDFKIDKMQEQAGSALRPTTCQGKACICLYKGAIDLKNEKGGKTGAKDINVKKCIIIDTSNINPNNKVTFLTYDDRPKDVTAKAKTILSLHYSGNAWQAGNFNLGEYATFLFIFGKSYEGTKEVYIEKWVDKGRINILVVPNYKSDYSFKLNNREQGLERTCWYSKDKSTNQVCTGIEYSSFLKVSPQQCPLEYTSCNYDTTNNVCTGECIGVCEPGEDPQKDCVCGIIGTGVVQAKKIRGYCADNKFTECTRYNLPTALCSLYFSNGKCTTSDQEAACEKNPCGYQNICYVETMQDKTKECKNKIQ